ncbi:MAG: AtpZ/AtpI family protein [Bacillota bacterium]
MAAPEVTVPMKYLAALTQIGLAFVVNVLVFLGLGYLIDQKLHLEGLAKIVGVVIGLLSGFYNSWVVLRRLGSKL